MAAQPGKISFERELTDFLLADNAALAVAAVQKTDAGSREKWVPALARVSARRGEAISVLSDIATAEVKAASSVAAVAASTSATVAFGSSYTLISASDYLKATLSRPLAKVVEAGVSLEVDPVRLQRGQELEASQAKFREVIADIVGAITTSADKAPPNFKLACSKVAEIAAAKFAGEKLKVVREFVLMRVFVGTITDSENVGIVRGPVSPAANRALYLVSKAIANLILDTPFNERWAFLKPFEPTLAEHQPAITAYLEAITAVPSSARETAIELPPTGLGELQEQLHHIERGISQLFLQTGAPEARGAHVCTDAVDPDTLAKMLDGIKEKVKDIIPASTSTKLLPLLRNWSDAKSKGTSVEAMMAATRETTLGRNLNPADQKLDLEAGALGQKLMKYMTLNWTDAEDYNGVHMWIMEGGIDGYPSDYISLKGDKKINRSSDDVLASLYNLSTRNKWDGLCGAGVTEVRKIANHSRIIHLMCKSPKADFVLLEHTSPPAAGLGGAIAMISLDQSPGFESGYPHGKLAPSGFVVKPVTDSDTAACRVTYMLNAFFPGISAEDVWGPAMDIICTLNKLEAAV